MEYSAFLLRSTGTKADCLLPATILRQPFIPPARWSPFRALQYRTRPGTGIAEEDSNMEASSGRFRARPIVVDFLGTLFATFCIGVATALVLSACEMLMAGQAAPSAAAPRQ